MTVQIFHVKLLGKSFVLAIATGYEWRGWHRRSWRRLLRSRSWTGGLSHEALSVLVGPEAVQVDEDVCDGFAVAAAYQIDQGDLVWVRGLDHVENLVLDVFEGHGLVAVLLQLLLDGAEKEVEVEGVEEAFLLDVEDAEDVLEGLRLTAVLERDYEVEIGLVVHFTAVCDALLENSVQKDIGQCTWNTKMRGNILKLTCIEPH